MPLKLFRRIIALLAIAVGLLLIAIPIWLFRDTTDTTRRILVDSGMVVSLFGVGAIGLTTIIEGVLLLLKKRHRGSAIANEKRADK